MMVQVPSSRAILSAPFFITASSGAIQNCRLYETGKFLFITQNNEPGKAIFGRGKVITFISQCVNIFLWYLGKFYIVVKTHII